MASGPETVTSPKSANPVTTGSVSVEMHLDPETLKLISELAAKLREEPAAVVGEALTFYSAVKEAHDDGGRVIVPSGVARARFSQEISLP